MKRLGGAGVSLQHLCKGMPQTKLVGSGPAQPDRSIFRTSFRGTVEHVLVVLFLLVLFALLTSIKVRALDAMQGDTAIFFQLAENIAERGAPVSQVFANTQAYLDSGLLVAPPEQLARNPLAPPTERERDVMRFHADLLLYPIALLVRFFPVDQVVFAIDAGCFLGLIFCAYASLRKQLVSPLVAGLFCALVLWHPGWYASIVDGQFYPDRLFMLAGFLVASAASARPLNRFALVAFAIVAAAINERGAIIAGLFLIAYSILYWNDTRIERLFKAGTGLSMLLYGIVMAKLVLINPYYGGFLPTNWATVVYEFHQAPFAQQTVLFLIVNGPLLVLALFEWRAAIIAMALMAPNILGNIGGAEKSGWATAYHSYYLPILIWAAVTGTAAAYTRARRFGAVLVPTLATGIAAATLGSALINPFAFNPLAFNVENVWSSGLWLIAEDARTAFGPRATALVEARDQLRKLIPQGATVATTESAMTFLYHGRTIRMLPIGIDTANFAIMDPVARSASGTYTWNGVISFLGPDQAALANRLIGERMRRDGYDLDHPTLFPALGIGVVTRVDRTENRHARNGAH